MAYVQIVRAVAAKYGVKYILEGDSFVAEGISPLGSTYIDEGVHSGCPSTILSGKELKHHNV